MRYLISSCFLFFIFIISCKDNPEKTSETAYSDRIIIGYWDSANQKLILSDSIYYEYSIQIGVELKDDLNGDTIKASIVNSEDVTIYTDIFSGSGNKFSLRSCKIPNSGIGKYTCIATISGTKESQLPPKVFYIYSKD